MPEGIRSEFAGSKTLWRGHYNEKEGTYTEQVFESTSGPVFAIATFMGWTFRPAVKRGES